MFDAGHTHGPTPNFIDDCPLCNAAKAARNQAIAHLAEALHLLSLTQPADPSDDARPTIRLNLGPIGITGDDVPHCHSVDLTAKHAEALADAVDSMHAHLGSDPDAPIHLTVPAPVAGPDGEAIGTGEYSAAAVAQNDTDLWDQVNDLFAELDPRQVTKNVLDNAHADNLTVNRALDSFFGEIADPYADEDDA